MGETGRWNEAASLFQRLIEDRIRVQGPEHPDTLDARHSHASCLGQAATEGRQPVRSTRRGPLRALGPDHPKTLWVRHKHAENLGEAGQRLTAIELQERLVEDRTRVIGADDPETLSTRHNHAHNIGEAADGRKPHHSSSAWPRTASACRALSTPTPLGLGTTMPTVSGSPAVVKSRHSC
ncbi:tetratricopeptide repeat protein [Streptomyces zhihengii]